jgi:hypothetical protein
VEPSSFGGGSAANEQGDYVKNGQSISVVCTATALGDESQWDELNSGTWLPSSAVETSGTLPDCDD